jgi:Fur family zinc uptake transcriptional regulator
LEIVWASHTPVVAYEILDRLRARVKRRVAPPTVYRALDFLLDQHFIHRIESLNAYIGCPQPDARHSGQFLICDDCGEALELDDTAIGNAVMRRARATGFRVERQTIEIHGCCPNCERRTDCG